MNLFPGRAALATLAFLLSSPALAQLPGAFLTRVYSEALGRAPDPQGWLNYTTYYQTYGCNLLTLQELGRAAFNNVEYNALAYDNTEKVVTLYRALLGREPDAAGFAVWRGQLDAGLSVADAANAFVHSQEFSSYLLNSDGSCKKRLAWGSSVALAGLQTGAGFSGTQAQLQQQLDATYAAGGGVVYLAQRTVVQLTSILNIPPGVRLATTGSPAPVRYAKQARLVRGALFPTPMLRISSGATLESVWVSGQRPAIGFVADAANMYVAGGSASVTKNNRTDTPAGWSTLYLHGSAEGAPCSSATVSGNLSVGYGSSGYVDDADGGTDRKWADGISNACENATITQNAVIDATDVGIVIFRSTPAVQRSVVTDNTIVAGGLPVIAAMAVEPCPAPSDCNASSFVGSRFENNKLWSSPDQYFVIALSAGSRPWHVNGSSANGVYFFGNTSAGIRSPMQVGILIDGATQSTIQSNDLLRTPLPASPRGNTCASANIAANSDGAGALANGSFQQPISWGSLQAGCLNH